jgi:hypothetical protein
MQLEQQPPNKPNFALVVAVAGAAMLVIFVLALLFVHWDGKHLRFGYTSKNHDTRLTTPLLPAQQIVNAPYLA